MSTPVVVTIPDEHAACPQCATATDATTVSAGSGWRAGDLRTGCRAHDNRFLTVTPASGGEVTVVVRLPRGKRVVDAPLHAFGAAVTRAHEGFRPQWLVEALPLLGTLAAGGREPNGDLLLWARAGFADAGMVARAEAAGMTGIDASMSMEALAAAGGDDGQDLRITVAEALAWWEDGEHSVADIEEWACVGVRLPQQRPVGLSVADARRLREIGVEWDEAWAGAGSICPDVLRAVTPLGKPAQDVVALLMLLAPTKPLSWLRDGGCTHDNTLMCDWNAPAAAAAIDFATRTVDADWADLVTCARAGMPLPDAEAHVRSGADMEPVRLLAALSE